MSIASRLNEAWLAKGLLACALWPLSLLMRAVVAGRRHAYHHGWLASNRMPVPVLVVGNRVVGGAGKTPTTIALLQHLTSQGWRPGVLSRGYKARGTGKRGPSGGRSQSPEPASASHPGPLLIDAETAASLDASATGDEPMLIWRRTGVPVMIDRDRCAAGLALLKAHPEIDLLVCDDGLQHLKLQRDVEVVVFDERGAGNSWLLPAGPLREPIDVSPPPQLRAAPIVLYNATRPSTPLKGHMARRGMAALMRLDDWWHGRATVGSPSTATPPPVPHTLPAPLRSAMDHADKTAPALPHIWAIAGIAHPQRFFDALSAMGLRVQGIPLDDHAHFDTLPWPAGIAHVIVTEKDAVKLDPSRIAAERPGCQVWVAALDFQPEDSFWRALDAALAPLKSRRQPHAPIAQDGHTTH